MAQAVPVEQEAGQEEGLDARLSELLHEMGRQFRELSDQPAG